MTSPRDLQNIAKNLLTAHPDEHGWRSAVNRSYYSIYHLSKIVIANNLIPESQLTFGGSHQQLFQRMIDCPVNIEGYITIKALGYSANKLLKPYREKADYNLATPFEIADANDCIAKAELLLDKHGM